jgi:hypothetical protein
MGAEDAIGVFDGWLVDDAETIEEDDDEERRENDADADAGSHAALSGGGGKALLLRVRRWITASPGAFGSFGHSGCLR